MSVFDALTDPTTDALLGLAQGFGAAAMPTRMPTPLGAVMGQGIGGMQQGLATGQALRRGDIQNQQARIGLDWYRNMTNPQGQGGAAFGAPAMTQDSNGHYIVSPQVLSSLVPMLAAQGKDPTGPLKLLESYATSGVALDKAGNVFSIPGANSATAAHAAAQGFGTRSGEFSAPAVPTTFDVPDGHGGFHKQLMTPQQANAAATGAPAATDQNLPRGIRNNNPLNLEYVPNQPGVAGTDGRFGVYPTMDHGVASAVNQLQRYGQSGVNTISGITAKWAPAGENDPAKYAQQVAMLMGTKTNVPLNMGDPQTMTRLVAAMGQVENGQMVDPAAVTRGVGMALNGAPAQGAGPGATPPAAAPAMPGLAGPPVLTPQQTAAQEVEVARQKAMNEAAASRTRLITTRAGVYDPVSNAEVYRQPEYHETIDPQSGTEFPTFVQPGENGKLTIMGGPPGMNGQVPPTKLGPGQTDLQKHLADNFANEGKQKYDGAMQSLLQLDQQDQNIRQLNQSNWSSTGSLNNLRMGLSKDANSILTPMGLSPIVPPEQVASWEDAAKVQKQLAFAQARQMGSREAASVVNMSLSATPGSENTPQGYQAISAGFHEMNYREGDLFNFQNQWAQTHNGNLIGAEAAFNQKYPPEAYGDRAISTIKPFTVKADINSPDGLAQFTAATQKFLPGTRVMINGDPKLIKVVPERPDAPIPGYIRNNFMQPQSVPNGR